MQVLRARTILLYKKDIYHLKLYYLFYFAVDVELTEGPVEAVSNNNVMSSSSQITTSFFLILSIILCILN